jgi:hypothetical protein
MFEKVRVPAICETVQSTTLGGIFTRYDSEAYCPIIARPKKMVYFMGGL